jgi:hypothetical protein
VRSCREFFADGAIFALQMSADILKEALAKKW